MAIGDEDGFGWCRHGSSHLELPGENSNEYVQLRVSSN